MLKARWEEVVEVVQEDVDEDEAAHQNNSLPPKECFPRELVETLLEVREREGHD